MESAGTEAGNRRVRFSRGEPGRTSVRGLLDRSWHDLENPHAELRQLRYIFKIVDAGSFSKASHALHVAQSALSARITELEAELGVQLLHRKRSGIEPTEHGRTFYRHAQRITRQLDDLPKVLLQKGVELSGRVAVGLPASTALRFAAPLLERVSDCYPGVGLGLFDELSGNLRRGIDSGRLDLAVMVSDDDAHMLQSVALMEEELLFVASCSAHALTKMPVADLVQERLALPSLPHGVRLLVEGAVGATGAKLPPPAFEANSMAIMLHCVRRRLANSVMPWAAVEAEVAAGALSAIPFEPKLSRKVHVCNSADEPLSPAAQAVRYCCFK